MRAWKAVVLINLALLVGVGWGYAFWGLRAAHFQRELAEAQAAAASGVERQWVVNGVVRAIFPELGVIVLTHGDITGYMPAMTMPFDVKDTNELTGLKPEQPISFRLTVTDTDGWVDDIKSLGSAPEAGATNSGAGQLVRAAEPLQLATVVHFWKR